MLKFWRWNEKLPPQPVYRPPPPSRQEKSEKGSLWFTVANRVWRPRDFSWNVCKIIWLAVTRRQERMIYQYIVKWGILIGCRQYIAGSLKIITLTTTLTFPEGRGVSTQATSTSPPQTLTTPPFPPHQPSLSTCNSLSMKIVTIFVHHIKPVPDNLKLYYVNLVYNFNLNAHYHIYKSWTFMISTASLTVASSKAVASLATVHVPSPLVTSAFSRRCVGLPPHVKKALVPRVNKYLCNNIIIVSTKLHPVNRVKK